jgi:hypothetical protein
MGLSLKYLITVKAKSNNCYSNFSRKALRI